MWEFDKQAGNGICFLSAGLYPFIPGDLLKIAIAAALPSGWRLLRSAQIK